MCLGPRRKSSPYSYRVFTARPPPLVGLAVDRRVEQLLCEVARWAEETSEVGAAALVGSHARGDARPNSDVDLVILSSDPSALLADPDWPTRFGDFAEDRLEPYGRLTSRRVRYSSGLEVEFGITGVEWAAEPDDGTFRVAREGLKVLWDPSGNFKELAAQERP